MRKKNLLFQVYACLDLTGLFAVLPFCVRATTGPQSMTVRLSQPALLVEPPTPGPRGLWAIRVRPSAPHRDCPSSEVQQRQKNTKNTANLLNWFSFKCIPGSDLWRCWRGWCLRAVSRCCALQFGTYFLHFANSPLTQLNPHPGKSQRVHLQDRHVGFLS